jgi:prevent-host-death family protein
VKVSAHDAETQFSRLLNVVLSGEDVVIHQDGKPVARLVAVSTSTVSPLGAMAGEFDLSEGWDWPLTHQESDEFWNGKW